MCLPNLFEHQQCWIARSCESFGSNEQVFVLRGASCGGGMEAGKNPGERRFVVFFLVLGGRRAVWAASVRPSSKAARVAMKARKCVNSMEASKFIFNHAFLNNE
jgi:hypothetical protein